MARTRRKTALWKDVWRCIAHSKGRFFSILMLVNLGTLALVGLYVSGPDMRATGRTYFDALNSADITVISDYGLTDEDVDAIESASGIRQLELGYFKDVTIQGTTMALRISSAPGEVSEFELTEGRLPTSADEIALVSKLADDYPIGSTITVEEKADATSGSTVLTRTSFRVVGYVRSSEIVAFLNMGQSTAGTGSLKSYGVVVEEVFDSDVHMTARMTFEDTLGLDPYGNAYRDAVQAHKDELAELLEDRPAERLAEIKAEAQDKIDDGQLEVDNAKTQLADAEAALADAADQIADAESQIADARAELEAAVAEGRAQLNASWAELEAAAAELANAKAALADAASQIAAGEAEVDLARQQVADGQAALDAAEAELVSSRATLDSSQATYDESAAELAAGKALYDENWPTVSAQWAALESSWEALDAQRDQIAPGIEQCEAGIAELESGIEQCEAGIAELESGIEACEAGISQYEAARTQAETTLTQLQAALAADPTNADLLRQIAVCQATITACDQQIETLQTTKAALEPQLASAEDTLAALTSQLSDVQAQLETLEGYSASLAQLDELKAAYDQLVDFASSYDANAAALAEAKAALDAGWASYEEGLVTFDAGTAELAAASADLAAGEQTLAEAKAAYETNVATYNAGVAAYNEGLSAYNEGLATLAKSSADGESEIADAEATLDASRSDYLDALDEYNDQLPDVTSEIADAEATLEEARENLDALATPVYDVDSRRETLGSEGYTTYDTVSEIVDSLTTVFPVFLYLVAALVTLSTMTRFVDEERINSGTLKALGYDDLDIAAKFLVYGAIAGIVGAIIGIALGHTLFPFVVYKAYGKSFVFPPIQLDFHWGISLLALVLALLCSVLPAWVAIKYELRAKPSELMQPKPPASGSRIMLENVRPVWDRLSFTHKVTARNLFRYKQRMLMTVLGVAGAVTMLVAGFGVQASIAGMGERQFGEIIKYDMIVADYASATTSEVAEVEALLAGDDVASHSAIHYESVSLVAGDNGDRQDITLIAAADTNAFSDYITLAERKGGRALDLEPSGAVISERLATLLGVSVGDVIEFADGEGTTREVHITGIAEMYISHFMFMSAEAFEEVFGSTYSTNASLVTLYDGSTESVERLASEFMALDGVRSVVQNTTYVAQVDTVVNSLDMIMTVLIIVATLLGIVIMYNLTNLNVSERIRELSTIKVLGFHSDETTMYIYRETILLTLLGMLVGFGLGVALHQYILWVVPPDSVMFNSELSAIEFIVPAVVTAVITFVLYFVVLLRLTRVDMLEALKSNE